MTQQSRDTTATTFDLPSLIHDLIQRARVRLKRRGCYKPEDCAPRLVMNYVFERKLRKSDRCVIDGRTIRINFPDARDPLVVLYKLLAFEVMGFQRVCDDCKSTALPDESGDIKKRVPVGLIDPATPESLLEAKELLERIGNAFPNETHRAAFDEVVLDNKPYVEVAQQFNVSVETLRQWICRDKKRIRKVLLTSA